MDYYVKDLDETGKYIIGFNKVDIGWRFCKDELPEKDDHYLCVTKYGFPLEPDLIRFAGGVFHPEYAIHEGKTIEDSVTQWCRLPEPLTEGEG
mgnify:CR=1 FL=1